jgi:hypothetical protein
MSSDLVSRLSEALDEAEALARSAFAEHNQAEAEWTEIWSGAVQLGPHEELLITNDSGVSRHIARWDPQAVLRLVAAHRNLVRLHERIWIHPGAEYFNDAHLTKEPMPVCASCVPETQFRRENSWPCRSLTAIAASWGITVEGR